MDIAREVARQLLEIRAVKLQPDAPFTWASGLRSPIYCDNRVNLSHPAARRLIVDGFREVAEEFQPFNAVAGVATAGIAWGALLADRLNLPFIYVRSKPKEHGRQNRIEGELNEKGRYLVIEDLISTGGSSLDAVHALREAGAEVAGILAIFTYGFAEASEAFNAAACPAAALSHYDILVHEAREAGYVTEEQAAALRTWRRDPRGWSERFA